MPIEDSEHGPLLPEHLKKVTLTLEWVSPEIAETWMKISPDYNRGLAKATIYRYANDMREDRWFFTGESVVFDEQGRLIDAWHRLSAIVESGRGQWLVVVRGVPAFAFHYIDHGRGRVFADTLKFENRPKPSLEASATSYLTGYLKFGRFVTRGIEEHERWSTFQQHAAGLEELVDRYSRRSPLSGVPPALFMAVHYVLNGIDEEAATEFMDAVATGDELDPNHPVAQFRAAVKKMESQDKKPGNVVMRYGAGFFKAWNLVCKNERVGKFVLPTTTPTPEKPELVAA